MISKYLTRCLSFRPSKDGEDCMGRREDFGLCNTEVSTKAFLMSFLYQSKLLFNYSSQIVVSGKPCITNIDRVIIRSIYVLALNTSNNHCDPIKSSIKLMTLQVVIYFLENKIKLCAGLSWEDRQPSRTV